MESLKLKVFEVLAKAISVEEFEDWLYSESEVINGITNNSLVYDMVIINYKRKEALVALEKIAFKEYGYEEFLLYLIFNKCTMIVKAEKIDEIIGLINDVFNYFDFETEYEILHEFYYFYCDMDIVVSKVYSEKDFVKDIKGFAQSFVNNIATSFSYQEKIQLLKDGILNN